MIKTHKIVISASRRTDIPAFYMPWFMEQIRRGYFEVTNPYNQRVSCVPATPDQVHTIVFWSKNLGPFIKKKYGEQLIKQGYHLFFNFTINSDCIDLEPNVPPLAKRLHQLEHLCQRFGPDAINWRFDPLCFFKKGKGPLQDNLHDFSDIATKAAECGIVRCITSFMDHYPKIRRRLSTRPGFAFIDPMLEKKIEIVGKMEKDLADYNIDLSVCCEKDLLAAVPQSSSITGSSCIPGDIIQKLFGGRLSLKKDTGQRIKAGCGCTLSTDIGSYRLQACYHNCLFCYANPASRCEADSSDSTPKEKNCR
ncbi:MAG: DUF1848 domain-containing protein [Desulfobacterales bacterium]